MDFNELWLSNLYGERAHVDSVDKVEAVGPLAVPGENPNELLLTTEDRVFLLEVGIRP
jgi:hypothetical protein